MTLTQDRRDELRRNSERMMGSFAVIAPYSISPQEVLALLDEAEGARINLSMAESSRHELESEDTSTVRRIWEVLGIDTYAAARGKSIVEHVADVMRRAELWENLHDTARSQSGMRSSVPDEVAEHVRMTPRNPPTQEQIADMEVKNALAE